MEKSRGQFTHPDAPAKPQPARFRRPQAKRNPEAINLKGRERGFGDSLARLMRRAGVTRLEDQTRLKKANHRERGKLVAALKRYIGRAS